MQDAEPATQGRQSIDSSTPLSASLGMTPSSRYRPFVPTEAPQLPIPTGRPERRFKLYSQSSSGATFQAVIPTEAAGGVEGSVSNFRVGGRIQHPASGSSGTETETETAANLWLTATGSPRSVRSSPDRLRRLRPFAQPICPNEHHRDLRLNARRD